MDNIDEKIITLLANSDKYLSANSIASEVGLSSKTIYNRIDKLNLFLDKNNVNIVRKQNMGIKLEGDINKLLAEIDNIKTNKSYITKDYDIFIKLAYELLISNKPTTIDDYAKKLNCSERLIISVINNVNIMMKTYNIKIEKKQNIGVILTGDELCIRRYYAKFYINDNEFKNYIIENNEFNTLSKIANIVEISEIILNEKLTNHDSNRLSANLLIMLIRVKNKHILPKTNQKIENVNELYASQIIRDKIKVDFDIELDDNEQNEITRMLISSRRQKNIIVHKNIINQDMIQKFIDEISITLGIGLQKDTILNESLLSHLKSAYRRITHGTKPTNPLLDKIRAEFSDIYLAVLTTIETLETDAKISFDSNEIGYICLHLVASINRMTSNYTYQACLICDAGATISSYLKSMIEAKFIEINIENVITSSDYNNEYLKKYDLIIFSGPLVVNSNDKIIQVSEFLENRDYINVQNWLMLQGINVTNSKSDEISSKVIYFKDSISTKEEMLIKYGSFLEKHELVEVGYTQSLFDREDRASTALSKKIAAPHGTLDKMLQTTMLIVSNKQIINWADTDVNLCIFLVIGENEGLYKTILINFIHSLLNDNDKYQAIYNANSLAEIKEIINGETR